MNELKRIYVENGLDFILDELVLILSEDDRSGSMYHAYKLDKLRCKLFGVKRHEKYINDSDNVIRYHNFSIK